MKSLSAIILTLTLLFVLNVQSRSLFNFFEDENELNEVINKKFDSGKNIEYEEGNDKKLDVYYDENTVNQLKPVVMFVHGGAWVQGSKEEYANFGPTLKERGYVAVLPAYHLYPFGKVEDMVNDIYNSIMWTYKNISKYGGNPNDITISGHSAGAHLTALTTLKAALGYENKGEKLQPLSFIKKLVLLNGPYDFDDYSVVKQLFKLEVENGFVEKAVTGLFNSKDISPTDLLKKYYDQSLKSIFPKMVFFYTSDDHIVPETSANGLIAQIERTTTDADIRYVYLTDMEHNTLTEGVKADEKEFKNLYINLIQQ